MMSQSVTLENDFERMVPEFHGNSLIYAEHFTRYYSAKDIVRGKVVLDIASGSGYGSKFLAKNAKHVYGVDINKRAVEYSQKHFGAKNLEYKVGDGESIPLEDNSVDVVVTFETIEHIKDYKKFLSEVQRVLKPDGVAIVSTPNELEFAEGNHFHLHEFEYRELMDLLSKDFKYIDPYFQSTWKYVSVDKAEHLEKANEYDTHILNLSKKEASQHLYFYFVCSNRKIVENIKPVGALGEHYSDRQIQLEQASDLATLEFQRSEITQLKGMLNEAHEEKIRLSQINSNVTQELRDIYNSRSWRAVKTVRKLKPKK